jgi:hypothetical protein
MNIPALLLLTTMALPANVLVLRSGHRIETAGPLRIENGRVIFRSPDGALFSLPKSEVDLDASRAAMQPGLTARAEERLRLRVSEEERKRLLAELEQNHSGQAGPVAALALAVRGPAAEAPPPEGGGDEWSWRNRAREHEETITRARENLEMLQQRAAQLRAHIAGLASLGYKPSAFTYDTTVLQATIEQIPYAELAVTRAERAYAQFRDEARRRGVQPGWLR